MGEICVIDWIASRIGITRQNVMAQENKNVEKPAKGPGASAVKLLLFVALGVSVACFFQYTDVGHYFSREYLQSQLTKLGIVAQAIGFLLTYILATMVAAPSTIFFILGGVLFGPLLGTVLVILGATLGASGAFLITRYLARDFVARLIHTKPWFKKIDIGVRNEGIYFVIFLRLVPFFPFNGVNFAIGLTHIRFRDFFFGTLIGIAPVSFVIVSAAAHASATLANGLSPEFYYSMALLGLLALTPVAYRRYGHFKKGSDDK